MYIPAGFVCQYQLIVVAIDGKETEQNVMNQFITFKKATSITFGLSERIYSDLNPEQSLSVRLLATWYHVPSEFLADLPTQAKEEQDTGKMNNILEMDSTQKICEYSKTTTLLKSKNWKNYF
jgi:hypothetical protein